jgi:glyoxylase-like metal-dependent hydrolase (beta-lactamase superfamily II)
MDPDDDHRSPPTEPVAIAEGLVQIDVGTGGIEGFNAGFLRTGSEPTLIETGSGADTARLVEGIRAAGLEPADIRHLVVTHIHLDHAGGAGALATLAPDAIVWVHERGAPHLADPERLIASTARTYGSERMRALFGRTRPVPAERLRAVVGGDRIEVGDGSLEILHTPGHASHHIAVLDERSGTMFTGEAAGSYLADLDVYRPALPPPEVDVELALDSLRRIAERGPERLTTTHLGTIDDPLEGCRRAAERIRTWSERVRTILEGGGDDEAVLAGLEALAAEEFAQDTGSPFDRDRYDPIGSIRMNAMGLGRYWRKRWEREAVAEGRSEGSADAPSG